MIEHTDDGYERLAARFRPLFPGIAAGAREREQAGTPPHAELQLLIAHGFAKLRVPREFGGDNEPLAHVLRLLAELAEADENLAHIWRNHLSFIEDRRHDLADPRSGAWLRRLGSGEIVGGGWSEPGSAAAFDTQTRIFEEDGSWLLSGTKFYATGSIFATWATVLAIDPEGERVVALVALDSPGVTVRDDWDGFGQRLTGSGSVVYDRVRVSQENVFRYEERYQYQEQFYQSALNALLLGIGRALLQNGVAALRSRKRSHPNAVVPDVDNDPQILETVGAIYARLQGAEAQFLSSLRDVHTVAETDEPSPEDLTRSWNATAATQLVVIEAVLTSATQIFDALGASGVSECYGLDRYWRNARTLASHNPQIYKRRILGEWQVNDADPAQR